jgi:hypothetical protein
MVVWVYVLGSDKTGRGCVGITAQRYPSFRRAGADGDYFGAAS